MESASSNEDIKKDAAAQHIEKVNSADDTATSFNEDLDSIEHTKTDKFVWLVAITASIGGFLFGYDTGIISAVLVYIHEDLGKVLTNGEKEAITSLCSTGAFFGAILTGLFADRYGRKTGIYGGCVLFTVGALLQATAYSLAQMLIGRLVVGFGVGSAAMIVPVYIAEIAPSKIRGRMIGLNNMSITGGQVISYAIGAGFAYVGAGWRWMVGLGGVPSVVLAILLLFCPESPRQLIARGRREEACAVLKRIFPHASQQQIFDKVSLVAESMILTSPTGKSRRYIIKQLHTIPHNLRALICACGLMTASQLSGFNVLMYYSSTLFNMVGFTNPAAVGIVVAGTNFIMTFVNAWLVDPIGRRRILILTVWGMSAALVAVAVAFHFIDLDPVTLQVTQSTVSAPAIVVLVFLIIFCCFYGVSVGNTAWMSVDFFGMEVRAMGALWMTACTWGSNVIVSSTFLSMMHGMTPSGTFGFYAAINFITWIGIIFFYPEVSGLTIEEVQDVFKHGFGVRYASKLRKERKLAGTLATQKSATVAYGH